MKFDRTLLTYRFIFHAVLQIPQMLIYYDGKLFGTYKMKEEGTLEIVISKLEFLRNNIKEQVENDNQT
jgi:hypothetical protein